MKYVIDTSDARLAELIYQGFVIGGSQQEKKPISSIRLEARLLDKLDTISELAEGTYPTGDAIRKFSGEPKEFLVTREELDLIIKYVNSVPWTTRVSREIVKILDILETAPERADLRAV